MEMDKFKTFLINEDRSFLAHKVSDILTSMQELQEDMPNLGSRHLAKLAEQIVNQIRKILHERWSPKNLPYLKSLQKIAVAIQKTIEERDDLKEIFPAVLSSMQDLSGQLGVKINNLEAPEPQSK